MPSSANQEGADPGSWIGSITYRSEATRSPSNADVQAMVSRARARNREVGVTGMLLHDGGRFLQTLEGPPDALDRIWSSIQHDPRHDGIEVISQHIVPTRLFSGWDMQLYSRTRDGRAPASGSGTMPLADHVPTIARLALAADDAGLNALIGDLIAQGWVADALVTHLIEPTARVLGDAWLADECSELDLTIALSILQLAGHTIQARRSADRIRKSRYSILLATAPGETHGLGSSLLGDVFTNAGWSVDIAFPGSDEALAKQVRSQRPDAVDIALSDAVPRTHALASLRETIERSRTASPDDVMVVSVGGRLFAEAAETARSVGADHARRGTAGTRVRLEYLVDERRKAKRPV